MREGGGGKEEARKEGIEGGREGGKGGKGKKEGQNGDGSQD